MKSKNILRILSIITFIIGVIYFLILKDVDTATFYLVVSILLRIQGVDD